MRQAEFRYQSYIIGALGTAAGLVLNSLGVAAFGAGSDWPLAWLPLAVCAALHYAATLRIASSSEDGPLERHRKEVAWFTAASATAFLFVIRGGLCQATISASPGCSWARFCSNSACDKLPKHFRWLSYFVSEPESGTCSEDHVAGAHIGSNRSEAISLAIATLVCVSVSARIFRTMPKHIDDWEREWCREFTPPLALYSHDAGLAEISAGCGGAVWTVLGLTLFEIGVRFSLSRFRLLAHLLGGRLRVFDYLCSTSPRSAKRFISHIGHSRSCRSSRRNTTSGGATKALKSRVGARVRKALSLRAGHPRVILARVELGPTVVVVAWALFGLALL